ncbi:MAG TPA: ECF-type sigma factor [Dokdonella sp.]|nr:ECF-type sigma factor [Dokdonella sp.]
MALESVNTCLEASVADDAKAGAGGSAANPACFQAETLFAHGYAHLKQLARRARNRSAHTLNTTGLVHELFLKLKMGSDPEFGGAPQFFTYAARAMRHILVDRAIRRSRMKFGGDVVHTDIDDASAQQVATDPALAMQLDSALRILEQRDARAAHAFELHFFAGLEIDKVAAVLGVSRRTADRDWRFARAFLSTQLAS